MGPLSPVSEVHGCLQQMAFSFHLWGAAKGKSRACTALRVSWRILDKSSQEWLSRLRLSRLVWEFLVAALWLLEGELSAQVGKFHLNYVCLYTDLHI